MVSSVCVTEKDLECSGQPPVGARVSAWVWLVEPSRGDLAQGQGTLWIDIGSRQCYHGNPLRMPLVEPRQRFLLGQTVLLTLDPRRGAHATTQ